MKKTVKTKVFATALAAICAVSAISAVSIMSTSVSAAGFSQAIASQSNTGKSVVLIERSTDSIASVPMRGEDWNYYADSLNVKIGCDYDYYHHVCHFYFNAVKPSITNAVLKTQRTDGKWDNTPIRIQVFDDMTMKVVQTGDAYVTEKSYTEAPAETSAPASQDSQKPADSTPVSADNTVVYPIAGEDWTYYINNLNVKVGCDYDYQNSICNFKITGVKPGTTDVVLKTQRPDGKWNNTPLRVLVQADKSVIVYENGSVYVTAHSYTE